jgi:hypothetical protein
MHVVTIAAAALVAAVSLASTSEAADPVVVTRDTQALPAGCSPRETAEMLARFAEAVNTGDPEALERIFVIEDSPGRPVGTGTGFHWYSLTEGRARARRPWRHAALYDRAELLPYFAERHAKHERWELLSVTVTPSNRRGAAGITFAFRRTADDLPSWLTGLAGGKGGVDCSTGRIFLWSSAQNDAAADVGVTCPRPRGWSPGDAVLACTHGPNAKPLASDFRVTRSAAQLPGSCGPAPALRTIRTAVSAFNAPPGDDFAKTFAPSPLLATRGLELRSRRRIAAFAHARYHAGEGWTARVLRTPARAARSGPHRVAVYRLELVVSRPAEAPAAAKAKITLDCASGLIRSWRGP